MSLEAWIAVLGVQRHLSRAFDTGPLALEGRRRVKEQLNKRGSFEYCHTSFSYLDNESGEEIFVGVPEQGGRDLISSDPLSPGTVYAAAVSGDGTVGLYRIEVSQSSGTGKLKGRRRRERHHERVGAAVVQLRARAETAARRTSELHVEAIDLPGNHVEADRTGRSSTAPRRRYLGVAFFVAADSILRKAPPQAALLVLGDMSMQGNVKPVRSLTEPLQVAMDNGAMRVLVPIVTKRQFLDVNADVLDAVDPIFYGDCSAGGV